eukprot:TRINITY_DN6855_c0_g1_i4.p1 TRINITY_DN6855_c0_g1~~TRINITY_DN6855_c0_g1_i4.p1  ORF type:complete len:546 (+),score=99.26 TRINITY_DN6855_c0_g1_i4:29-1639(+)
MAVHSSSQLILFNKSLAALARQQLWERALSSLLRACRHFAPGARDPRPSERVRPDIVSFNAVINACGRSGEWTWALLLLRMAADAEALSPNIVTYNTAITALGRARRWALVLSVLDELLLADSRRKGLQPDAVTFSAAISALERVALWERALSLLASLKAHQPELRLDAIVFGACISACEKGWEWQRALALLEELRSLGFATARGAEQAYNATISACEKALRWTRALQLLQEAPRGGNLVAHNAALSACGGASKWAAALAVLARARDRRLQPDLISYTAAIAACGSAGRHLEALALLQGAQSARLAPKQLAFNACMAACAAASEWAAALRLWGDMRARAVPADAVAIGAFLRALERAGRFALLQRALRSARHAASEALLRPACAGGRGSDATSRARGRPPPHSPCPSPGWLTLAQQSSLRTGSERRSCGLCFLHLPSRRGTRQRSSNHGRACLGDHGGRPSAWHLRWPTVRRRASGAAPSTAWSDHRRAGRPQLQKCWGGRGGSFSVLARAESSESAAGPRASKRFRGRGVFLSSG